VSAWAVPGLINYQGKLLENGVPLTTATPVSMTFKIFIEETDTGGSPLWVESQNVEVVDGVYSVKLAVDPSIVADYNDYWLEVTIDGEILQPRQRLTSTFFALRAAKAEEADNFSGMVFDSQIPDTIARDAEITWGNLTGIPADLADGDDVGVTAEEDPTVPDTIKDGISWNEVQGIPAGFADGVDNNSGGDITGVTAGMGLNGGGVAGNIVLNVDVPLELVGSTGNQGKLGTHDYGVYGSAVEGNSYAGYFSGRTVVGGGVFELNNSAGENWLTVLRGTNQNAGFAFKEQGATDTQWIFPYFRGWQSDNLIIRDEQQNLDVMTFQASTGRVGVGTGSPSEKLEIKGNLKLSHPDSGIIFNDGSKQVTAFPGSGPGSSLDADTLDGLHAADIVSMSGGSLPSGSDIPLGLLVIEGLTLSDPTGYILDGTTVSRSVDVVKYLDGDGLIHKRPGNVKAGDISISHIVAVNAGASALANWFQQVKNGTFVRRSLSMVDYRPDTTNEFLRINFFSTFPAAISYRPVSASTVEETVVLAVEEFEILTDSTAEINGNWRAGVESLGNMYVRDIKNVGGGVEIIEYLDGDDPRTKKRPGHYNANDLEFVDLGAGSARKFLSWHFSVTQNCEKRSIGNWYGDVLMFNAYECWPSSFSGISLDAQGEFVINKAIMSGEMVERPQ
ncbi:MAG: hypothetical protein J7L69_09585, partial [Desulfobulbaceae bacterium]|nr:hypothetical protein [Desulfobulbaceae bacterium]